MHKSAQIPANNFRINIQTVFDDTKHPHCLFVHDRNEREEGCILAILAL